MSDLLIFVTEPTGQMLWTNPAFLRLTGFTLADFQFPNPDNPFLHPDDAELVVGFLTDFAESDEVESAPLTNRFFAKWGEVLTVDSRVHKVEWEGKLAFRVEARLVPNKVEAPEEQNAALYRALVEASPDGIARMDSDGRHFYSNPCLWEILGIDAVGLKRFAFHEVFPDEHQATVREAIRGVASTGKPTEIEVMLPGTGERSVELRLRLIEGVNDDGVVHLSARETTRQRQLEARLHQGQKLESLGLLAGGIAHDFNNLLTSILGNLSVIAQQPDNAPLAGECLGDVRVAAEHAAALTRSMLAYSGRAPVELANVDLGATLDDLVPLVLASTGSRVRIEFSNNEVPGVWGDEAQLTQVLLNLLTNAADALGSEGGNIRVKTGVVDDVDWNQNGVWPLGRPSEEHSVCVSVRDEGSGIDDETLGRMFDPFFSTKGQGRGLGLSSVLGILRAHGGVVGIEPNPGRGTCIHVALPRSHGSEEKADAGKRELRSDGSGAVLFVDDQEALRVVGARILSRAGYEVITANSGQSALEQLEQHPGSFVAVVLDESMPSMSGATVLRTMRADHPDLPVLRTSGVSLETVQANDKTAFLAKPYNASGLVDALQDLLGAVSA